MLDDVVGVLFKMIGLGVAGNFGLEGVLIFLLVCAALFFAALGVLVVIRRLRGS
ncbi:MAG: hypothetical protein AB7I36_09160 [Rhodospirillaceae bacterium]